MALLGMTVAAKTVALWPMEADLRCVVDTRLDLSQGSGTEFRKGVGWEVPPNPDGDRHLAEVYNATALWPTTYSGNQLAHVVNADLANALCSTSDFTLEGWINVQAVPDNNGWYILANVNGGSNGTGGWIWSMRRQSRSQYNTDFELFVKDELGDTCLGGKWFADPGDLTNKWLHVAMTHCAANAQGKSEWCMYTNGVLWGSAVYASVAKKKPSNLSLELGGRGTGNRFRGALDYWRVSDRVLAPEEFLCAGGEGSERPTDPSPTAYYWKLDRAADGTIDSSPQVSRLPLSGGLPAAGVASTGRFHGSADQAFVGNPPNTTVTLPGGNCGSFSAPAGGNLWRIADLGAQLEITNDFTVEGWFKPERNKNDGVVVQYMFNTRLASGGGGWALGLQNPGSSRWYLQIFVQQLPGGEILVGNGYLSPDLSDWTDWKHVALAYDHAAADGKGVWTCYVDGVLSGAATNNMVPTATTGSQYFHIGGRYDTLTTFHGGIDCVRVSRGVLDPRQLLCTAVDCQAVPEGDVLAFWPLDAKRGAYLVGDDLTGNYTFQPSSVWTASRMAGTTTDAPVISNPDRTLAFAGSGTNLSGSVAFNTPANGNAASSELSAYSGMSRFFRTRPGWTAECYVKRTAGTPTNWELLLGSANNMTLSTTSMCLNFTYRSNGFVLLDGNINCNIYDTQFPLSSGSDLPVGEWAHVALTFRTNLVNGAASGIYEVFVNGASKGTITSRLVTPTANEQVFLVGGRVSSGNSFKGNISSLRLSSRVLEPSEFLCGTPTGASSANATIAYWPLDFYGTTVDAGSRVMTGAGFSEVIHVEGSTTAAAPRVPRGDASADFVGDPRANSGSVVLSDETSRLVIPCLGLRADVDNSFTVEGWFKWSHAEVSYPREVICGTYRPGANKGWKLYLDTTGTTPCVRLMAMLGYPYSRLEDDVVLLEDASDWVGSWKHLAVTYDVHAGARGVWTLWVDGKVAGSAENLWSPQGAACSTELFGLGAIPANLYEYSTAVGGYDMWRLSEGALTKDEFLYKAPNSTLILVR